MIMMMIMIIRAKNCLMIVRSSFLLLLMILFTKQKQKFHSNRIHHFDSIFFYLFETRIGNRIYETFLLHRCSFYVEIFLNNSVVVVCQKMNLVSCLQVLFVWWVGGLAGKGPWWYDFSLSLTTNDDDDCCYYDYFIIFVLCIHTHCQNFIGQSFWSPAIGSSIRQIFFSLLLHQLMMMMMMVKQFWSQT